MAMPAAFGDCGEAIALRTHGRNPVRDLVVAQTSPVIDTLKMRRTIGFDNEQVASGWI
jgi:hypothetical protein